MNIDFEQIRHIGKETGTRVLGLPVHFADEVVNITYFGKVAETLEIVNVTNKDNWLHENNDYLYVRLTPNFKREITLYKYVSYGDMVSHLGGLKSAITPLFDILTPTVMLMFLWGIVSIIQEIYTKNYKNQIIKSI